jgi:hypothetical protein
MGISVFFTVYPQMKKELVDFAIAIYTTLPAGTPDPVAFGGRETDRRKPRAGNPAGIAPAF